MNFENLINFIVNYVFNNFHNLIIIFFFIFISYIIWIFGKYFKKELFFLLTVILLIISFFYKKYNLLCFLMICNLLFIFLYEQIIKFIEIFLNHYKNKIFFNKINSLISLLFFSLLFFDLNFWFKYSYIDILKYYIYLYEYLYFFLFVISLKIFLLIFMPFLYLNEYKHKNVIISFFSNIVYYIPLFFCYIISCYLNYSSFSIYKILISIFVFLTLKILSLKIKQYLINTQKEINQENLIFIIDVVLLFFNLFNFINLIDIFIFYLTFIIFEYKLIFIIQSVYFIKIFQICLIVFLYYVLNNLIYYLSVSYFERYTSNFKENKSEKNVEYKRVETIINILIIVFQTILVYFVLQYIFQNILETNILSFANFAYVAGAIAFGLQTFVKDFVGGFFNVIEGTLNIGDRIKINDVKGQIEEISLRVIKLRDLDGALHIVPFHKIDLISHYSKKFIKLLITAIVKNKTNIKAMENVLNKTNKEFIYQASLMNINNITDIEIIGLTEFILGGLKFEIIMQLPPRPIKKLKAVYNKILKNYLDEEKIELIEVNINSN